jgi:hypothetical protein
VLPRSLGVRAVEFVVGFALSGIVGVLVGLAMGRYRHVEYALDPVPLANKVRVVDLQLQAAQWYWLIKPSRTGCRRMRRTSARSVIGRVTGVSMVGGR